MEFDPVAEALNGTYYKTKNPTPDTGIAANIQTSFSATKGLICIYNNAQEPDRRVIVLDYIRLLCTVAPASAVSFRGLIAVDKKDRYSSGGSVLSTTPGNVSVTADSEKASIARVNFGALTLNAEGAAPNPVHRLGKATIHGAIPVVLAEYILTFGVRQSPGFQTLNGTAVQRQVVDFGPAVIPPGSSFVLHDWYPSNAATAAEYEPEIAWIEKPRS